jgi:hypothetical protein
MRLSLNSVHNIVVHQQVLETVTSAQHCCQRTVYRENKVGHSCWLPAPHHYVFWRIIGHLTSRHFYAIGSRFRNTNSRRTSRSSPPFTAPECLIPQGDPLCMAFRDAATGTTNVALMRVQTLYAPSQKHCCLLHPVGGHSSLGQCPRDLYGS